MAWHPEIAVIGAGAVGGYYGARLAQHGNAVHFLMRSDFDAVRRYGLTIHSCDGDFALPPQSIRVYDDPARMPQADLVIIALKTTANDQYEPLVRPLLKADTLILTLQNGLGNEQRLAELFGPQRILGGLAFVCINRLSPGVIHHMDYGLIRLGEFIEGQTAAAQRVVDLFNKGGIKCELLESLRFGRWKKLVWNVPFNGLGGVLDMPTDQLTNSPEGVEIIRQLMQEVVCVAHRLGAMLPVELIEENIRSTASMGSYLTSTQIDRQMGRPMEVEALLGEPVRAATLAGVATPYMEMLYRLAKLVDTSKGAGVP